MLVLWKWPLPFENLYSRQLRLLACKQTEHCHDPLKQVCFDNSLLRTSNNSVLYAFLHVVYGEMWCDRHNIKSRVFLQKKIFVVKTNVSCSSMVQSNSIISDKHTRWHPTLWSCCGGTGVWIMLPLADHIIHILIGSPRSCVMLSWLMLVPDHETYTSVNILHHYDSS